MRYGLIFVLGAALAWLWAGPAAAKNLESACENAKLRVAARYNECLIRVFKHAGARGDKASEGDEPSEEALARCGERFDRAFERAEASGACRTPGGSSTLREPLKANVRELVDNLRAATSCAPLTIIPGDVATCSVNKSLSAIDLATVVGQLSGFGTTDDTAFWIQAWGGNGSDGNVCCEWGGPGGPGGYAQTTTSLNALESAYGTTDLYYYLGLNGTFSHNAGGDGGTSTLVTVNDLAQSDVDLADTLLFAGGGGGGGAGRGKKDVCDSRYRIRGGAGGNGGAAFSVAGEPDLVIAAGADGGARGSQSTGNRVNNSGQGGQVATGGAGHGGSAEPGGDPTAPLGARGGNHLSPQIGFANASGTQVTGGGGRGSDGGNEAGGGGGGGGFTGGGGGNRGVAATRCVSGGGGGGSSFVRHLPGSPTCAAAPRTRPANPNGIEGFVQITFDLGACE